MYHGAPNCAEIVSRMAEFGFRTKKQTCRNVRWGGASHCEEDFIFLNSAWADAI